MKMDQASSTCTLVLAFTLMNWLSLPHKMNTQDKEYLKLKSALALSWVFRVKFSSATYLALENKLTEWGDHKKEEKKKDPRKEEPVHPVPMSVSSWASCNTVSVWVCVCECNWCNQCPLLFSYFFTLEQVTLVRPLGRDTCLFIHVGREGCLLFLFFWSVLASSWSASCEALVQICVSCLFFLFSSVSLSCIAFHSFPFHSGSIVCEVWRILAGIFPVHFLSFSFSLSHDGDVWPEVTCPFIFF